MRKLYSIYNNLPKDCNKQLRLFYAVSYMYYEIIDAKINFRFVLTIIKYDNNIISDNIIKIDNNKGEVYG